MNEIINVEIRTAETVMAEVKCYINQINQTALDVAIKIGNRFKELKELVPHGDWLQYIEENVGYSSRKVQNLIKIADEFSKENSRYFEAISNPHTCADLELSKVIRLISVPENEVIEFVEKNPPEEITVKELEKKIKELKESKEKTEEELKEKKKKIENSEITTRELEAKKKEVDSIRVELALKIKEEEKLKEKISNIENEQNEKIEAIKVSIKEKAIIEAEEKTKEKIKELEETLEKTKKSSEKDLQKFALYTTEMQRTFNEVLESVSEIETKDQAQAKKMRLALEKILNALIERIQ